ncbi:hypothetical protein H6G81_33320 [Scytonema hofmannii FACHB-248]|uniref:Uncharacterized protein n=1 Tax=Scytonema hofmannii FACHB-248 TaxID=1842502 RepID=A0ABR8H1V8_9CYAN|nr:MULTISPECIES: hypothetical protein [Nostocales]MBD2609256.1 hypothetical protein [Scytonema hofmannii FACHB-248]
MQVEKAVVTPQELNLQLIVLDTIALPLSKYVSFFCQGTSDIRDLYR